MRLGNGFITLLCVKVRYLDDRNSARNGPDSRGLNWAVARGIIGRSVDSCAWEGTMLVQTIVHVVDTCCLLLISTLFLVPHLTPWLGVSRNPISGCAVLFVLSEPNTNSGMMFRSAENIQKSGFHDSSEHHAQAVKLRKLSVCSSFCIPYTRPTCPIP